MRERGLSDLHYFNSEILGYGKAPFNLKSACHEEMNRWLQDTFTQPKRFSVMLEPRGHGKSVLGGAGHSIWRMVRNPNIMIRYVHSDEEMAAEVMSNIRDQLESNDMLRVLYEKELVRQTEDAGRLPNNTDDQVFINRTYSRRSAALRMLGYKSGKIGTHVPLFILDDLVNEKTCATPTLMEGVKDFIRKLPPLLADPVTGRVLIFGTRWDQGDAWGYVTESDEFQNSNRALIRSCFMDPADTICLWPEKYTPEILHEIETQMTPYYFAANYRNEPIPRGSQLFDVSKVKRYDLELGPDMRPKLPTGQNFLVYTAVDPQLKEDGKGDHAAVLTVARDGDGNHFVLDLEYGKPNSIELVLWMRTAVQRWRPITLFYEALCGQRLLLPWIKRDMAESGVFYPLQESKRPFGIQKGTRIRALASVIETGKLWVPNSVRFRPLLKEIEYYTAMTKAPKDDCLDCLADIYSDGYDCAPSKPRKRQGVQMPWQTALLDTMIEDGLASTGRGRITSVESNRPWRRA